MKNIKLLLPLSILVFMLSSCVNDKCKVEQTYMKFVPTYASVDEANAMLGSTDPQDVNVVGKIYVSGNYVLLNERDKGIHVIDNTDPVSPQKVSFITIPGNIDMSVKGNTLYADSYNDLITIDMSDPANVAVMDRDQNVFPDRVYTNGFTPDPSQGVIIGWTQEQVTEIIEVDCGNGGMFGARNDDMLMLEDQGQFNTTATGGPLSPSSEVMSGTRNINPTVPGIAGSLTRFTIDGNVLYTVDNTNLHVFDISNPNNPNQIGTATVGWNVETIFPYEDALFIGSSDGVFIYDNTNPANPQYVSQFNHVTACDPVVVENDIAYVTLRTGNACAGFTDQLDILDVSDLSNPTLITSYVNEVTNPHGVGILNSNLFLCDGAAGLKVFNASNPSALVQAGADPDVVAIDVIPMSDRLIMVASDGLYQYDYSDINNLTLLSHISTVN